MAFGLSLVGLGSAAPVRAVDLARRHDQHYLVRRRAVLVSKKTADDAPPKLPSQRKPVVVVGKLRKLLGVDLLPRNEVVKRVAAYARTSDLQSKADKRQIVCDKTLKDLFGVDQMTVISIGTHVSQYTKKPEQAGKDFLERAREMEEELLADVQKKGPAKSRRTRKMSPEDSEKKRRSGVGIWQPLQLSAGLQDVCGGATMSRPDIVKRLWAYVKSNGLQDPNDGRTIICDDKLRQLFGNEAQVTAFEMNKWISKHVQKL